MPDAVHHHAVETDDIDVAREILRATYGSAELASGALAGFRYLEETHGDEHVLISRLGFAGEVQTLADVQYITIASAVSGYLWEVGDERGALADQPALFQFGHPIGARIDDCVIDVVNFDRASLAATARRLYVDDTIRLDFDSPLPASPTDARRWMAAQSFARDVAVSAAYDSPLVRASLNRGLAVAALEGFRLAGDRVQRSASFRAQRRAFTLGSRFLEDNASLPITVDDAAQHAGVSTHQLVTAFLALGSLSPAAFLQRVRLAAAHQDLTAADSTRGDTVGAIATRWGFAHAGSFARRYREHYGVSPRWTLER
ncbi:helix-turn-helix transcriptional regulator [Leifsonia sp. NPDC058248]|uniref:helix-turn-helix transcriptional regulator n=1 Tax=Leifsonia sp. NPDC058248 TaxID=3346402 RepID=UPI0036DCA421